MEVMSSGWEYEGFNSLIKEFTFYNFTQIRHVGRLILILSKDIKTFNNNINIIFGHLGAVRQAVNTTLMYYHNDVMLNILTVAIYTSIRHIVPLESWL